MLALTLLLVAAGDLSAPVPEGLMVRIQKPGGRGKALALHGASGGMGMTSGTCGAPPEGCGASSYGFGRSNYGSLKGQPEPETEETHEDASEATPDKDTQLPAEGHSGGGFGRPACPDLPKRPLLVKAATKSIRGLIKKPEESQLEPQGQVLDVVGPITAWVQVDLPYRGRRFVSLPTP